MCEHNLTVYGRVEPLVHSKYSVLPDKVVLLLLSYRLLVIIPIGHFLYVNPVNVVRHCQTVDSLAAGQAVTLTAAADTFDLFVVAFFGLLLLALVRPLYALVEAARVIGVLAVAGLSVTREKPGW